MHTTFSHVIGRLQIRPAVAQQRDHGNVPSLRGDEGWRATIL